jgi:hypothetical protein
MCGPAIMLPSEATKSGGQAGEGDTRLRPRSIERRHAFCDGRRFLQRWFPPRRGEICTTQHPCVHVALLWSERPDDGFARPALRLEELLEARGRVKRDAGISAPMAKKSGGVSGSCPTPSPIRDSAPSSAKIARNSSICSEDKPSDCKADVSTRAEDSRNGRSARHKLAT